MLVKLSYIFIKKPRALRCVLPSIEVKPPSDRYSWVWWFSLISRFSSPKSMELSSTVFVPANEFDAEEAVEFELWQPEVEVVLVVILLWLFDNDFKELERLVDFHRAKDSRIVNWVTSSRFQQWFHFKPFKIASILSCENGLLLIEVGSLVLFIPSDHVASKIVCCLPVFSLPSDFLIEQDYTIIYGFKLEKFTLDWRFFDLFINFFFDLFPFSLALNSLFLHERVGNKTLFFRCLKGCQCVLLVIWFLCEMNLPSLVLIVRDLTELLLPSLVDPAIEQHCPLLELVVELPRSLDLQLLTFNEY